MTTYRCEPDICPLDEVMMQSRPIWSYIFFGTAIRYLQDVEAGNRVHKKDSGWYVLDNIKRCFSYLEELNLTVTQRTIAASKLAEIMRKLEQKETDAILDRDEAKEISTIVEELRSTLQAEATGHVAFIVTDKRYAVENLVGNVDNLFGSKVFGRLPEIAKYDFGEAGKCIAFERPTAAAFHLLRGTESVLRDFYCSVVKRNRVDPLTWGLMVSSLKKRRKRPPDPLLDHLDSLRRNFRNPTQHPDKTYDSNEVQDLLGICIDVVNRMALPERG